VAGVPVATVTAGGVTLAYLEVGDGPAVLLVPGYTGSKEDFGPLLAPLAEAGYRAIAVDLRGQLDSAGVGPLESYDPPGLAADLLALIDALGLAPVHLVGHSYGGLVARAAVLAAPERFASLTLLCSGPAAIGGVRARLMGRLRGELVSGGVARVAALLTAAAGGETSFETARFAASSSDALLGMGDALLAAPDQVEELGKALATAGIPVLVACGAADDAWAPAVQREMAGRLDAHFAEVPGAGHSPAVEAPERTAALLLEFLA
jgi:pimeloyl-ACP methyl ester carboxylesterase